MSYRHYDPQIMTEKPPAPSDLADKFMLRLPNGMRARIKETAEQNNRSMNAEIIARLESSFSEGFQQTAALINGVNSLQRVIGSLVTWYRDAQAAAIKEGLELPPPPPLDAVDQQSETLDPNKKPGD